MSSIVIGVVAFPSVKGGLKCTACKYCNCCTCPDQEKVPVDLKLLKQLARTV